MSTKSPKSNKQYVWEGDADSSSFKIREETDPNKMIPRGTQITLFLRVLNIVFIQLHACIFIIVFFFFITDTDFYSLTINLSFRTPRG